MKNHLSTLVVGIVFGIVLGLSGSYFIGERYTVMKEGALTMKTDHWTGKSWLMLPGRGGGFVWQPVGQE